MLLIPLGNLIYTIGWALNTVLYIFIIVLFVRALISWVQPNPRNPIVMLLTALTDPLISRTRKRFPFLVQSGLDFTPMGVFMVLFVVNALIARLVTAPGIELAFYGWELTGW